MAKEQEDAAKKAGLDAHATAAPDPDSTPDPSAAEALKATTTSAPLSSEQKAVLTRQRFTVFDHLVLFFV